MQRDREIINANRDREIINANDVKKIVFNGGGVKGAAHVMAYAGFIACGGDPSKITDVAGTSAGSIIAALIATGHNAQELHVAVMKLDFKKFLDEKHGHVARAVTDLASQQKSKLAKTFAGAKNSIDFVRGVVRIIKKQGIFDGEKLRIWIEDYIYRGTGIENCTFKELHELHCEKPWHFKDLHVVALNVDKQAVMTIDHTTFPDAIISDAVLASCSIPLFFKPHKLYLKGTNNKHRMSLMDTYVDGGVINNYPLNIFREDFDDVLGFYLCEKAVADYVSGRSFQPPSKAVKSTSLLIWNLSGSVIDQQYAMLIKDQTQKNHTIAIDSQGINAHNFDLSDDQQALDILLRSGWQASCQYFGKNIDYPLEISIDTLNARIKESNPNYLSSKDSKGSSSTSSTWSSMTTSMTSWFGGGESDEDEEESSSVAPKFG